MRKNITVLGSTGSIGRNTLAVAAHFPDAFRVVGLAAGENISLLQDQIARFDPDLVSVSREELAAALLRELPPVWEKKVVWGETGLLQVAALARADLVVSAIVGAAGLLPTLTAIRAGKDIALANKESLVMAGELVMHEARQMQVRVVPVDSEHNAIAQSLAAGRRQDVTRIILTASGGPFLALPETALWDVTPDQAVNHPNWTMGRKISIDSATLMNKGLEVIEARWLFAIELDRIEVLIHPQSVVHSMVEYIDGSVVAQLGIPDMRIPIAYAMSYPERLPLELPRLSLASCRDLSFSTPDPDRFPALALAYDACRRGGTMPAAFNAANEIAVAAFLAGRIRFPEITRLVADTISPLQPVPVADEGTVLAADREARARATALLEDLPVRR